MIFQVINFDIIYFLAMSSRLEVVRFLVPFHATEMKWELIILILLVEMLPWPDQIAQTDFYLDQN